MDTTHIESELWHLLIAYNSVECSSLAVQSTAQSIEASTEEDRPQSGIIELNIRHSVWCDGIKP